MNCNLSSSFSNCTGSKLSSSRLHDFSRTRNLPVAEAKAGAQYQWAKKDPSTTWRIDLWASWASKIFGANTLTNISSKWSLVSYTADLFTHGVCDFACILKPRRWISRTGFSSIVFLEIRKIRIFLWFQLKLRSLWFCGRHTHTHKSSAAIAMQLEFSIGCMIFWAAPSIHFVALQILQYFFVPFGSIVEHQRCVGRANSPNHDANDAPTIRETVSTYTDL